ncbi:MAG: 3-keto-5-aminohexanoate cleavage protein [Acidimicrobiales bacterium]
MQGDAVIIEVALNEAVTPATHAHVPQSPAECATDARRCAEAGAAIAHWHAVDASGTQRLADADLYGQALDTMAGCVLGYPSYPIDVPDTVEARLSHCLRLRNEHGMELGPLDVATVNLVFIDTARSLLAPLEPTADHDVIRNSLPFVAAALTRYREVGLVPTVAAFDVGSTRTVAALAQVGILSQPFLLKIFLWGSPLIGPEPSVEALDLHLRQIPDNVDIEWIVVPYGITEPPCIEELARAALDRGGGVRIGIGDNPTALAHLDNPRAVELAPRWATEARRPVASATGLRQRLGIDRPHQP